MLLLIGSTLLHAQSAVHPLALAAGNTSQPAGQTSDPPLDHARDLYRQGAFREADPLLKLYLGTHPHSAEAAYLLARTLEREDAPKDSLHWFTAAASLAVPTPEDLRLVARDYVLLNDYPDALHWLERSVQQDPRNPESWYNLARVSMMQGDFTTAETALKTSLQLHPRSVKAADNLGVGYEAQNRIADAARAYQEAVSWHQTDPHPSEQPLLNYGTLLLTQLRSAEALPLLVQAASIAPRSPKVHEQLAHAWQQQQQLPKAEAELDAAIDLDPANASFHFQLGQMYRRSGDLEKSREELALSSKLYGTKSTPQN